MEMIFLNKDLRSIVDGKNVRPSTTNSQIGWDKRDQRARTSLITSFRDNKMHLVTNVKTSKEVWDTLATIFETQDITSNVIATTCFYSQKMREIESVAKPLSSFNVSKTQLKAIRTTMAYE